jgi:hypothetical protein
MKKSYLSAVLFPVLILFFVPARTAPGAILAVPQRTQEKTEWCWAGVSQAIFAYYGRTFSQTQIAQYGTNGYNTWNYLYGSDSVYPYYRKGINMILSYFALLSSTYGQYVLNTTQVNTQINSGRPFIIRWGWDSGGGHFVAGRGISGNYVYIMDPGPTPGYCRPTAIPGPIRSSSPPIPPPPPRPGLPSSSLPATFPVTRGRIWSSSGLPPGSGRFGG